MKKKISFLKLYFGFFGILSAVLLGFFVNRHQTSSKQTNLEIQYQVGDELVQSTVVLRGNKKFSAGEAIIIAYLPEKPEKQVPAQKLKQDAFFMVLYGLFMAAQIMVVLKARKKKPERKNMVEQTYA